MPATWTDTPTPLPHSRKMKHSSILSSDLHSQMKPTSFYTAILATSQPATTPPRLPGTPFSVARPPSPPTPFEPRQVVTSSYDTTRPPRTHRVPTRFALSAALQSGTTESHLFLSESKTTELFVIYMRWRRCPLLTRHSSSSNKPTSPQMPLALPAIPPATPPLEITISSSSP